MRSTYILIYIFIVSTLVFGNGYKNHKIQKGETIWRISKNYGVPLENLCKINNIKDVTKVKSGSIIKIPIKGSTTQINNTKTTKTKTNYKIHYLEKDETLWRISKKYGISVDELLKINGIKDIKRIKVGSKIMIPVSYEYLDYKLPVKGNVSLFTTSHFDGIHIFTEKDKSKRNIFSIEDGFVSYIDNIPGYGLTVFIRHNNDYISTYSGFEKIYVSQDGKVKSGQLIGMAGKISRYDKYGILFSIQKNGKGLKFDLNNQKFIKNPI